MAWLQRPQPLPCPPEDKKKARWVLATACARALKPGVRVDPPVVCKCDSSKVSSEKFNPKTAFATPAPAIMLPRSTTRSRLAVIHKTENFHVNRCFVELQNKLVSTLLLFTSILSHFFATCRSKHDGHCISCTGVFARSRVRRNHVLEGLSHPGHFVRIRRLITCTFWSFRRSAPPVTIWNHACAERSGCQLDFEMPDQHHAFGMRGRMHLRSR